MLKTSISKKIGANLTVISLEIEKQNFPIEFYTKNAGNAVVKIINAQNETDKTINHLADKGFNTINYDLTVNATEKSKKQMMAMFISLQENTR